MKQVVLACVIGLGLTFSVFADDVLKPLDKLPLEAGEVVFLVQDGEANVNDELIRRIAVGSDKVTASYRNQGTEAKRPRYTIRLYNQHGLLIGENVVGNTSLLFGGVGPIKPGDVATEDMRVSWLPLDRIVRKSTIALPKDWKTVKWVVISESNTMSNR
jgi:predicted DNA-binding antitoxin AbrB/MazE fold protein